jgi:toxin YoeB
MRTQFEGKSFEEYNEWIENKQVFKRLLKVIKDIHRSPYEGIGKPEPLKYELSGYWSREITEEHRIVYRVVDDTLEILSCKHHYTDL